MVSYNVKLYDFTRSIETYTHCSHRKCAFCRNNVKSYFYAAKRFIIRLASRFHVRLSIRDCVFLLSAIGSTIHIIHYLSVTTILVIVYRLTIDDSRLERTNEKVCIRNQNGFIESLIRRTRKEFLRRRVFCHLLSSFEFLTIGGGSLMVNVRYTYTYTIIYIHIVLRMFSNFKAYVELSLLFSF